MFLSSGGPLALFWTIFGQFLNTLVLLWPMQVIISRYSSCFGQNLSHGKNWKNLGSGFIPIPVFLWSLGAISIFLELWNVLEELLVKPLEWNLDLCLLDVELKLLGVTLPCMLARYRSS